MAEEKDTATDPVSKVPGCLKLDQAADKILAEMRDTT